MRRPPVRSNHGPLGRACNTARPGRCCRRSIRHPHCRTPRGLCTANTSPGCIRWNNTPREHCTGPSAPCTLSNRRRCRRCIGCQRTFRCSIRQSGCRLRRHPCMLLPNWCWRLWTWLTKPQRMTTTTTTTNIHLLGTRLRRHARRSHLHTDILQQRGSPHPGNRHVGRTDLRRWPRRRCLGGNHPDPGTAGCMRRRVGAGHTHGRWGSPGPQRMADPLGCPDRTRCGFCWGWSSAVPQAAGLPRRLRGGQALHQHPQHQPLA